MHDIRTIVAILIASTTAALAGCSSDEGVAKPVPVDSGVTSDSGAKAEGSADQVAPDAGVHEGGHAG
jgi:hypothetical protein